MTSSVMWDPAPRGRGHQSKEMSWASLPPWGCCTAAGAGGGCCCWGAPPAGVIWKTGGDFVTLCTPLGPQPHQGCSTHLLVEGLLARQVRLLGWQAAHCGFLARQG